MPIILTQDDLWLRDYPHNNFMVISCNIKGFIIRNVLVDNGSAANTIFFKAFKQMKEDKYIL
jgi:hypothetical protein